MRSPESPARPAAWRTNKQYILKTPLNNTAETANQTLNLYGLAYLSALGALFFNVQPVMIGAIAGGYGYDEVQLGNLVSAGLLLSFASLASSFFWITRVNRRYAVIAGGLVYAIAMTYAPMSESYNSMVVCFAIAGAGGGAMYAPILVGLAAQDNPTKAFSLSVTFMVITSGAISMVGPAWLVPAYGTQAMFYLLAVLTMTGVVLAPTITFAAPTYSLGGEDTAKGIHRFAWIGLAAFAVYFLGLNGTWAFLERAGNNIGLSPEESGVAVSLSLLLSAVGSFLAGYLEDRIDVRNALTISLGGMLLFASTLWFADGFVLFFAAILFFNTAWNFSLPFAMNSIAMADETGRYVAVIPAAQMLGAAMGPAVAAPLIISLGFTGMSLQLLSGCLISFVMFAVVSQRVSRLRGIPS